MISLENFDFELAINEIKRSEDDIDGRYPPNALENAIYNIVGAWGKDLRKIRDILIDAGVITIEEGMIVLNE